MTLERHGLSVGIERVNTLFFLRLKAVGKLTHEDYRVITPMIDSALAEVREPQVLALIDATEMDGWELRAAWDDFRLALRHGNEFVRVAIYGNKGWQETIARIGSWFVSGDVKFFESQDEALDWLLDQDKES